MQPLGRKFNPSKEDHHPHDGRINWWEDVTTANKKFARQQAKREIEMEINIMKGEETI